MKALRLIVALLLLAQFAQAGTYTADPTPLTTDSTVDGIHKINKLLNDPVLTQRTWTGSSTSTPGTYTVSAGTHCVLFVFGASFTGTVAGVAFVAGESITFRPGDRETNAAFTYVVTTGSIRVFKY